jgi:hypothetical protein
VRLAGAEQAYVRELAFVEGEGSEIDASPECTEPTLIKESLWRSGQLISAATSVEQPRRLRVLSLVQFASGLTAWNNRGSDPVVRRGLARCHFTHPLWGVYTRHRHDSASIRRTE